MRRPRARRPAALRPVDGLIYAHGLASFCLGLAVPYTAIYLAAQPGVGTGGVALFYAVSGGANLTVALLLSSGVVRLPRIRLGVVGTLLWLAGYLGLFAAGSAPAAVASGLGVGSGQGCYLAALIPLINDLITPGERRKVFARRYAVLNATLALGALSSGLLTAVLPRTVIPYFFLANAVGILPLTAAILATRRQVTDAPGDAADGGPPAELPMRALWKVMLPPALFQLSASLFAFSQFESTAPLVTNHLMHMPLFTVSLMLTVDVVVIVLAQRPMTRRLEKRPETAGLRLALAFWVAGYLVTGALAFEPFALRMTGLMLYVVLFGLGECAYSCSFHPWLISQVPDRDLTRANALVNSMMGVGNFMGPSIGVAMAATGSATVVWLGLAAGCSACATLTAALAARRRPAVPAGAAEVPQSR